MRFLLDQDVYAATARFLRALGHDAVTAAQIGGTRTADVALLRIAHEQGRVFVTRDRDFGGLVFVKGLGGGVVYLRVPPLALHACHLELQEVLRVHSETDLRNAFVVVEPGRHRFRRLVRQ